MEVVIMRGMPGFGKTRYVTRRFAAHKTCLRDFLACLEARPFAIFVDNTNLDAAEIAPYYALAEQYVGPDAVGIRNVKPPRGGFEEAFKRQQHGIPFNNYVRMASTYLNAKLPPWWNIVEVES